MIDFNQEMKKNIDNLHGNKPSLLLHSCCAPCSSAVIEKLQPFFDITVFYYNPNILPRQEYEKRKLEQKNFLDSMGIEFIEGDYDPKMFSLAISGMEDLSEGSERCKGCYRFRIEETAKVAENQKFDFFTTTLTVSPHKNVDWINEIMQNMEIKYKIKHLPSDFKKESGYLRSVELSKKLGFYRQNYCGCRPK